MNITLVLGTFYALASLSAGCFSTKTNKYHLRTYLVKQDQNTIFTHLKIKFKTLSHSHERYCGSFPLEDGGIGLNSCCYC